MELPSPSVSSFLSDDEESVAGSDLTTSTAAAAGLSASGRRRKRVPRRSTRYAMCHPAPQLLTKQRMLVQIRPRLLLQLQRLGDRRPTPAFDVVPSSIISGTIIIPKLAKRFPGLFRMKPELGQDDLLVVRSEDYSENEQKTTSDGTAFDDRDLIAVISPVPELGDDGSEIILDDGTIWTTSRLPNGSYEFTSTDILGKATTARWVKRPVKTPPEPKDGTPLSNQPPPSPSSPEYRWTFSIINPSTRRHPIMGVIAGTELEIYHTYNTLSASSGRFPPSRPFNLSTSYADPASPSSAAGTEERLTEFVAGWQKNLMMASASWMSVRSQGWPASLNPKMRRTLPSCRHPSNGSHNSERRRTFPAFSEKLPQSPSIANTTPVQSLPDKDAPTTTVPPASDIGFPRRTMSTGAAYMRKKRLSMEPTEVSYVPEREKAATQATCPPNILSTSSTHRAEEKTHTCRIKVLGLTRRLFHRKDC